MSYAASFLNAHGVPFTILRTVPVSSKISIRPSVKSARDFGAREAFWEAFVLAETNMASGELFQIGGDVYLVHSASATYRGELAITAVKTNCTLAHYKFTENIDAKYNLSKSWVLQNALYAYGEIVTAELRARDPGLLQGTRYIFQIPKQTEVEMLDRIVFNGANYQVDALDDIGLKGVMRIQASEDNR